MTIEDKRKSAVAEVKALLEGDGDRLRLLLQRLLQEVLEQEMTEALAAGRGAFVAADSAPRQRRPNHPRTIEAALTTFPKMRSFQLPLTPSHQVLRCRALADGL